jgi:glycine cleavage system aminomethyltransferase T
VLRLQKQHPIIGQDTDSEMTPFGAGMDWIVKLDKPQEFIGKWALESAIKSAPHERLVGFTTQGELPTEGAAVVRDGVVVGQVTSARRSPKLGGVIGLATVPADIARDEASFVISDDGAHIRATVQLSPFYDPEGEVVRG